MFWSTSRLAAAAKETVTDADVRTIAGVAAKAAVGFDEKDMRRARDALVGLGERTPIRWRQMIEAAADARKDGRLLAPREEFGFRLAGDGQKKKKKKKRADGDEKDDERARERREERDGTVEAKVVARRYHPATTRAAIDCTRSQSLRQECRS